MQMEPIENFEMLPRRDRLAVRTMLRGLGLAETTENLANEAARYRRIRGWFVWINDAPPLPSTPRYTEPSTPRYAHPE